MSDTYLEAVPCPEPVQQALSPLRALARGLKWILILIALGWVAMEGISLAIQHTRLNRSLTTQIAASFGRPVEVGSYDFVFWGGPALEAQSITVAEDPRFGSEYFLRAESMTVGLRWQSLLRGRIQLGTLSLIRPSLNLVRNADGVWNLDEWLPRPGGNHSSLAGQSPSSSALRFSRIQVENGRVNFKRGDEKLPLALIGVTGTVETDRPGRWRMDFEAAPWRAAIVLQQMGVIHVSGDVGGTSSRLRPAALDVTWSEASLPDVLRLALGNDDGIRGDMALALNARTQEQDDDWAIQGRVQLRQIHRYDLPVRPDNPSVNLITRLDWRPAAGWVELKEVVLESPHSNAHGSGTILWNSVGSRATAKFVPVQFTVSDSQIGVGDLLAWFRAFRPGIAENISAAGTAGVHADISGWPMHIVNATLSTAGIDLSGPGLRRPAHLSEIQLSYARGAVVFRPIDLSWGGAPAHPADPFTGSFRMDITSGPARKELATWHIAGNTSDVRDLIIGASALGWNISHGWDLAGQLACDARWQTAPGQWPIKQMQQSIGWIEFGGSGTGPGDTALHAPFLNRPIEQIKARAEWKPGVRHVALASAQAFGASWIGTLDRRGDPAGDWQFTLSADRLVAADLDRWLNPLWRESFLDRMLPFLNPSSPANAVPEALRAEGHLSLDDFTLDPIDVHHLEADVRVEGRHLVLGKASGQFYGGTVTGTLDADLNSPPVYSTTLDFSRVDLRALSAESPALAGLFAGSASGTVSFQTHGATRSDLFAGLECQGTSQVANAQLQSIDLGSSLRDGIYRPGSDQFAGVSAAFSCAHSSIEFQTLAFVRPGTDLEGSGTVDFGRNLDLRFKVIPSPLGHPDQIYRLAGPLSALQVTSNAAPSRHPR